MQNAPYQLFATIPVKPQFFDLAKEAVLNIIPQTLAEEGCELFVLHEAPEEDNHTLYLYERFKDEEAYNHHHAQPYTKEVFKKYENWLSGPVIFTKLRQLS